MRTRVIKKILKTLYISFLAKLSFVPYESIASNINGVGT